MVNASQKELCVLSKLVTLNLMGLRLQNSCTFCEQAWSLNAIFEALETTGARKMALCTFHERLLNNVREKQLF